MQTIDVMDLFSAMRHISGDMHRRIKELIVDTPLKGYHVIYLARLMEGGPQTAKELSLALGADKGHTSRVLSDLLSLGYIEKGEEARMAKLTLTPQGREIALMASRCFSQIEASVSKNVTMADFEAFVRVLKAVKAALESDRPHCPGHHHQKGE